jgi:exodeoxyribonuclease VII large subunit
VLKPEEARRPWTVSELAGRIQAELAPLRSVFVKGEVSGMKQSVRGHYSFTVSDAGARLEAFLFANDARKLAMLPEDGHEYVFRGRVDFWAQGGRIRLLVDYVEFDDVGKLRAQLERLKQRLDLEGAFAPERKRPLPFLPRAVALITSPVGAVIHDLEQTILDRFPNMNIYRYPAVVQGALAPAQVAAALRQANLDRVADIAIVARGGGSFEELYAFNTEPVVRAILASRIPVVTALGHTSDRTLADMVADAECRTPTEAGARVVPHKADLTRALVERRRRIEREAKARIEGARHALSTRAERLGLTVPRLITARRERLARSREALVRLSPARQLARRASELAERRRRLDAAALRALNGRRQELARRRGAERLLALASGRLQRARADLEQRRRRLDARDPHDVLQRGYSITRDALTGAVLRDSRATARGRRVNVQLANGSLAAEVEEVS